MNTNTQSIAAAFAGLQSTNSSAAMQALNRELARKQDAVMKGIKAGSAATAQKQPQGGNKKVNKKFPVEPRTIQIVNKPRTFMNHSYRDFSSVPRELGDETPSDISQMSFPQKVHHILSQGEFSRFVSWQPHGRAFRINIPKMFETKVCSKYMGHTRYSSFLRQLSNHSFKHITQGKDRNCYYHEFMLRGVPHLCKYMPQPKDARRLISDPANEPSFDAISAKYPLPGAEEPRAKAATKPKTAERMAHAGTARLSSDRGLGNAFMPPTKRARVAVPGPPAVGASVHLLPSMASAVTTEQLLVKLFSPSPAVNGKSVTNVTAALLLAGTTPASAPFPVAPARSPLMMSSAASNGPISLGGDPWAAFRAPQMQTSVDRNAEVLSLALRVALTAWTTIGEPTPPPRADPAAILADFLLQQASNPAGAAGSPLDGLWGGRF